MEQKVAVKNVLTGEILQMSVREWINAKTQFITAAEATEQHKVGTAKFLFVTAQKDNPTANNIAVFNSQQNTQPKAKKCNCR